MAQEAVLVYETQLPIPFTCADGTGIERGAVVKMADPATISLSNAAVDVCGGILSGEKVASDGFVKAGVYRGGIFKVYLSGSCTVGDPAVTDSMANHFKSARALTEYALSGSRIFGIFLETGTTGETVLMELRPMSVTSGAGGA